MFRSRNGLDRTILEWLSKCKNNQAKFNLIHLYGAYGIFISRLVSTLSIPVYLNTGKKCWMSKTLTLAGDMQWTYAPSPTIPLSNLNFSSLVFREKLNVSQTIHSVFSIRN